MKARKATALCLTACLCVLLTGCAEEATVIDFTDTGILVEAAPPEKGDLIIATTYMGSVAPEEEVMVYPMVSGVVTEANYSVGDQVSAGDVLFRIDDTMAQIQLDSANATYNTAQANVNVAEGSTRELQNSQTEAQIRSLYGQLNTSVDTYDTVADNLDDLDDKLDSLESTMASAQAAYGAARMEYERAKAAYEATLKKEASESGGTAVGEAPADGTTNGGTSTDETVADETPADETTDGETSTEGATDSETTVDETADGEPLADETADETPADVIADSETPAEGAASSEADTWKAKMELARINMEEAQANYEKAAESVSALQASRSQLEATLDQTETAYDQLLDSIQAAEEAYHITNERLYVQQNAVNDAQLSAASVGIESAEAQLAYYTVKAPISGTIEAVSVKEHAMVSAGYAAYTISNKENMVVTFSVTETAAREMAVGDTVEVERAGKYYQGTITEVGTMASAQTRLFTVKASLGQADEISTGVSVKVNAASQKALDVLKIPYDALYFQGGRSYVYCVVDGKAVRTEVAVGLMNDTEVEILDGIGSDSLIVTSWSSQLKDGAGVIVKTSEDVVSPKTQESETGGPVTGEGELAE